MSLHKISSAIKWWNLIKAQEELKYSNHKRKMIKESFKKISAWNISGAYLEFGTYKGQSVVFAYEEKKSVFGILSPTKPGIEKIYAFDSFQGIKGVDSEEKAGPFFEGTYSASYSDYVSYLEERGVPINEIITIPGFFQDSLTDKLQSEILEQSPIAAVVNIDCDIYLPSLLVLNFVGPMLRQGSIVLFDDWYSYALHPNKGEVRALNEFLKENTQLEFIFWKDYGPAGKSFIVSLKS